MILTCAGMYILRNHLMNVFNLNEINENKNLTEINHSIRQQIPIAIRDFSSQYGANRSDSYVVSNICSKPEIYPLYGDSTHALAFRTYGPWWLNMPSYKSSIKNFSRWEYNFTSRDFIDIEFNETIYEYISLDIYETYNPGTIRVVYIGKEDDYGNILWYQVWKYPQLFYIKLTNNEEFFIENNEESRPTPRLPRIVKIPLGNKYSFPIKFIRLEFDHSKVNYYSEIDTVILCDQTSSIEVPLNENLKDINHEENEEINYYSTSLIDLPFDILFIICSYLDFRSLVRLSSTCHLLHTHCLHPLQFQSVNLQPYWNGITNNSIENFFLQHCTQTQYLSLSWTKSIQYSSFNQLLNVCSNNLLQLNLSSCQYLTGQYIKTIVNYCPNIEILYLDNCISLNNLDFIPLKYLNHLHSLNVYRTKIDFRTLLPLIENNKKSLQNINLGSCQNLIDAIGIIKLIFSRCSNLRSIDLWRTYGLTQNGLSSIIGLPFDIGEEKRRILNLSKDEQEELALLYSSVNMPIEINSIIHMKYLSEVDLGWTDPPPGFIKTFVQQIGHTLIKLFLTACRRVTNEDIVSVSEHCQQLRQLDLLGSNIINETTIECILKRCLDLEFLDLSFCDKISNETISIWMCQYKTCFKRSYPPTANDQIYTEFP